MDELFGNMSLAEFQQFQQFAKIIGEAAGNIVVGQINDVFLKIFGTVFTVLAGAISYLHLSQRKDGKQLQFLLLDSYVKIDKSVQESKLMMETVSDQLTDSKDREKKALESLENIDSTLEALRKEIESFKTDRDEQNN